jgi:predicted dehydrogenase
MSCASYAGSGHRIEFFGEDGSLILHNPGADYMRGFELFHARQGTSLERVPVEDPADAQYPDGRIAPVSRLAKLWFDAIERGGTPTPGFAEGYRVQRLIDMARRSHSQGTWIDVAAEDARQERAL